MFFTVAVILFCTLHAHRTNPLCSLCGSLKMLNTNHCLSREYPPSWPNDSLFICCSFHALFQVHDGEALFLCTCFEPDLYLHIAIRVVWTAPREEDLSFTVQRSLSLLRQWMIKAFLQGVSFYHGCSVTLHLNKVLKSFTVTLLCISKILYCLLPEIHPIFTSIKMPHNYQENYLGIIHWAAPCKIVHLYKQKCHWHPTVIFNRFSFAFAIKYF